MPKHFFSPESIDGDRITLTGPAAHHMLHVLRIKHGEKVLLCDGNGVDYKAVFISARQQGPVAVFTVEEMTLCKNEPKVPITLYQALPKGDKMEWIVQKCVEIGVKTIVPVQTMRTVVRAKNDVKKILRYERVAESAAGQSMRGTVPKIQPVVTFREALNQKGNSLWLVAYEGERGETIRSVLKSLPPQPVGIWVGPEGGFDESEASALISCGAHSVSLGRRILRTETAGMAAMIQVLCLWEAE